MPAVPGDPLEVNPKNPAAADDLASTEAGGSEPAEDLSWTWRSWYVPLALAGGVLLLWPLINLRFLGDDFIWVYEAAHQSLPGLFQRGYFEFVRPANELYWFVMWSISGTDPRGYHLLTMGLYALTALLLYRWVRELTDSPWAGFAALCLFLANPVHAEPVGWPSACSEALAGAFVLASLYGYRRWRLEGGRGWMGGTLAALALAFGSKESSIAALPGLLLVEISLVPQSEALWARARALLTMFVPSALMLLAAALSVSPQAGYNTTLSGRTVALWTGLVSRALLTQEWHDALLRMMPRSADLVVCVALAAGMVLSWRRAPAVFLHLAWLPCTLLAYAVFVPDLTVSDRYFYMASIASSAAAGCLLARLRGNPEAVWAVLLAIVVAMGLVQTAQEVRRMAEGYGLPQPEALTLPAALDRHRAGAPVFVYCPPRAELHSLYACAVLGNLDLQQIRPWPDVLRQASLPEGSVAIFWDQFSNRFAGATEAARRGLQDMIRDGRAPRTGAENLQKDSFPLTDHPGGQGWTGRNMTPEADGTWTTPGIAGRLSGPEMELSPYAIQAVHVDLEVLQADPGAVCGLLWYSQARPGGQETMEVVTPLPVVPGNVKGWLYPGERLGWWTQGQIRRLELVLSSSPARIRVNDITVYGLPRLNPEAPPKGSGGLAPSRG